MAIPLQAIEMETIRPKVMGITIVIGYHIDRRADVASSLRRSPRRPCPTRILHQGPGAAERVDLAGIAPTGGRFDSIAPACVAQLAQPPKCDGWAIA
jgi:hypothetical protein